MTEHDDMPEGTETPPEGVRTMAIVRWILVVAMALAALLSIAYVAGVFERPDINDARTTYYCPMHPSVVQDHPGTCPICNMDLVPREGQPTQPSPQQGTQGESASTVPGLEPVPLTPERIQLTGMQTAAVTRAPLAGELRVVGYVSVDEKGLAEVTTRFAGWIESLVVNETGEKVDKGQVLGAIYSPELLTAQQELLNARRWAASSGNAASLADDARRRLELLGISATEIEQLERSGEPVRALKIRSPVAGHVIARNVVQGAHVDAGTTLFEVANLERVWVQAEVYEADIPRVKVGQPATLTLPSQPGQSFVGRVQFLAPTLDPQSRTLKVRLEFPNRDLALRPGMFGEVAIALPHAQGLVIPREALVDTGQLQYVFVVEAGARFVPRAVKLGGRTGESIVVLEGLEPGETVVTTANFLLDSESRLRSALTGGGGTAPKPAASTCDTEFDAAKYPEKAAACRACEVQHRGMGSMVDDCKAAIPKPWR